MVLANPIIFEQSGYAIDSCDVNSIHFSFETGHLRYDESRLHVVTTS